MRGYDEYENLDEYETDGEEYEDVGEESEGEEEQEEEEVRQPTQEELEYLELRQRLKDKVRKQLKKDSGSALANGRERGNKLPYDNYGSFFGPSQPVIAQRVIQESKSLLENPHLAARVSKSNNGSSKAVASTSGGSRPQANNDRPPKVTEAARSKTKVQMLKNTRDYSFLLSDDSELPAPMKAPPPRNVSVPKTEAQSAQVLPKNKQLSSSAGRKVLNGHEERRPVSKSSQMQPKVGPHKLASSSKPKLTSVDSRKQLGSNNGSGPGRPSVPITRPSVPTSRPSVPKGLPSKKPSLPSRTPTTTMEKKAMVPAPKSSTPAVSKPLPSNLQPSGSKKPLDRNKEFREPSRGKIMSKQPAQSSKPQMKQPLAKNSARPSLQENRPKKRPARPYSDEDDDDDGSAAISMIRSMFRYNPNKYRDDDDDSDMEANFDDILREEKRSAKIARKEDEEELRKIEEEERRERLRKEAKKRKLNR